MSKWVRARLGEPPRRMAQFTEDTIGQPSDWQLNADKIKHMSNSHESSKDKHQSATCKVKVQ